MTSRSMWPERVVACLLGILLFALIALLPAMLFAQALPPIAAPGSVTPLQGTAFRDGSGNTVVVDPTHPLPTTGSGGVLPAAGSTAQYGNVTSTAATATSGSVTYAGGVATVSLLPDLGRPVRVILSGSWTGTVSVSTSSSAACTNSSPLTIGGATWGVFSANANEFVDTPSVSATYYCATATVTAGTLYYGFRQ